MDHQKRKHQIPQFQKIWGNDTCCCSDKGAASANGQGAIKQRIQSSHMPPCHRHMVVATNFSSLFDLLLCSTPQTRAECCLELTAVSGYRMFLGQFG